MMFQLPKLLMTLNHWQNETHRRVTDENNNLLPNYNGEVAVTIFDKTVSRTTYNNDGNSPITFNVLGSNISRKRIRNQQPV
jgi:hypothetical protein